MSSYNSTPRHTSDGWNDKSTGNPPAMTQSLPQHLPMVPILAAKGSSVPAVLADDELLIRHGTDVLDFTSPYFTFSNLYLQGFNSEGNVALVKRMILPGAVKAAIGLGIEVVESQITQYQRNTDGTYTIDANGNYIVDADKEPLPGFKARWVTYPVTEDTMGAAKVKQGTLTGDTGAVSSIYPICDFILPDEGAYGNLTGFRFFGPTNSDKQGTDEDFIRTYSEFLYRLQIVVAPDSVSTPVPISNTYGTVSVDFCLGQNVLDESTQTIMSYDARIPDYYKEDKYIWDQPLPLDMHMYDENVDTVLDMLYAKEKDANDTVKGPHELNFANGVDVDDVPYYTFEIVGPSEGGLFLSSSTNVMCEGGVDYAVIQDEDGNDMTLDAMFDKAVREYYTDLVTNESHELRDRPKYPFRQLYDAGFTLDTKYAMIDVMAVFPDVNVCAATQDINDDRNELDAEYSIGNALVTRFQMHPESTTHGTPAARGTCVMQTGYLPNSVYRKMVPLNYSLAMKRARFGGASNGVLKGPKAYDLDSNNRVTELTKVNHTFVPETMRSQIWEAGITYAQTEDQESVFFPAIQTIYSDKTSVLLSDIVMNICCYITSLEHDVWRKFTGNSKWTPAQIEEKAAKYFADLTPSTIFDDRVVVEISVSRTKTQVELGYAYTPTVKVYANNMALLFAFELETYRMEALGATN